MSRSTKLFIHDILAVKREMGWKGTAFQAFIVALIVGNVFAITLVTVPAFASRFHVWFVTFETFTAVVFTIEYVLRLWVITVERRYRRPVAGRLRYAVTPLAVIDLLAVGPLWLFLLFPGVEGFNILRVFVVLRLFKLARYSTAMQSFGAVLNAKKQDLGAALGIVVTLLVFASSLMFFVEHDAQPENFASIPDAMWWGVITLTTVGYGDAYPVTLVGRLFGAVVAILGVGLFALPAGILASGFSQEFERRRRKRHDACPTCGQSWPDDDAHGR